MSSFTSDLKVSPLNDGRRWKLLEEFDYYLCDTPDGAVIHVPQGYVTDFASIPQIFWNILPPWGVYGKAAVIHDYLYGIQGNYANKPKPQIFTRKECDLIFLDAMKVLGVNWLTRRIMYSAVRTFGGFAWKKCK
jgi:hypothetical protein